MTNQQGTNQGPTEAWKLAQHPPERRQSAGDVFLFLIGFVAWGVGFFLAANAGEQDEPMLGYTLAVGLAVVGGTFVIAAVLYNIASRFD